MVTVTNMILTKNIASLPHQQDGTSAGRDTAPLRLPKRTAATLSRLYRDAAFIWNRGSCQN